jgi:hypothetical protein
MRKISLNEQQKERLISYAVVLLGLAVLMGQMTETVFSGFFQDMSMRQYIDPVQYMIAMLMINFIFVMTAIRRYGIYPNPILDTVKWYFTVLLVDAVYKCNPKGQLCFN